MDNSFIETRQINELKVITNRSLRDLLIFIDMPQLPIAKNIALNEFLANQKFTHYQLHQPKNDFKKLGAYAEYLFEVAILQNSQWSIVVKNQQIIDSGFTRGEIDFLLQHKTELIHIELASKFYIKDLEGNLIGPNGIDYWEQKKTKMTQSQSTLVNQYLEKFNLKEKVQERIIVKSRVFTLDRHISTFYFAIYKRDLDQLEYYGKYFQKVDSKKDWFYPFYLEDVPFERIENIRSLIITKSIKICLYDHNKNALGAGFILPNHWPN